MKAIAAILLVVIIAGCEKNPEECGDLRTVRHDGHTWVLCNGGRGTSGGVVHHPDCPCMKKDSK